MSVNFPNFRHAFVTGCAGFIGSNLADRLLAAGVKVVGYDDLSTRMVEFLTTAQGNPAFTFVRGDVLDERALQQAMAGADVVFHLAANADVRFGIEHPRKDLDQNTIAFHAVIHARDKVNVFNLGSKEYCEVNDSIGRITAHLGLAPELEYTGGTRGWIGDNPFIFLDTARIGAFGWQPKLSIRDGVERTIAWLTQNEWVLDRRDD